MKTARILIAHEPQGMDLITTSLQGYDLVPVTTIEDARYHINQGGIDLFLIGIHFDDSRAVEMITGLHQNPKYQTTPVVVVRLLSSQLVDFLRSTTGALIKLGTISQYLEIEGDPDASIKIKEAVKAALQAKTAQPN